MCEPRALCSRAVQALLQFALWRVRLAEANTQTTRSERDTLARHAKGRLRPVEIGVWQGVTTRRLRAAMHPDAELWAIDPYVKGRLGVSFPELIAHGEVDLVENGRVRWIKATGAEAAEQWKRERRDPTDFVFVDGDHSWDGISTDWNAWNGLVAPGGIVALHDSRSTPERPIDDAGSVRFTQEFILKDDRFRVVDEVDSLTVVERVG
jgi:predicted O-methyltransferase YrrM